MTKDLFWWTKYTRPLSESLEDVGLSQQDATEMVDKFQREFPLVKNWLEGAQMELTDIAVKSSGRAVRGPNLSDDTYQLVKSIAKWVYANSAIDYTSLLTQNPKPSVDAGRLLDYLSSATGISRKKINEWVWSGMGETDNG